MAKRFKRAFTIVELVIVIAVIAILAAVLIPTFTTLIDKANQSNDTVTVKNLNTAIASAQATEEINTMQDALDAAQEYGYTVDKLTPSSSGDIVWDQVSKRFALVDKDGDVVYSDGTLSSGASLWKIAKDGELSAKYSNYLSGEWSGTIETGLGVDVGANEGLDIKYTNSNAQTVMFRTNGGTLTIDAPNDTVNHYGTAVKVVITEVKDSSYHLYGEVLGNIELAKGRVVVEDGASASTILVTSATAADIKIDVNNNATVGTVAATTAGVITSENTTVPSTTEKVEEAVVANNDFAGGLGTEKSPYLIANSQQVKAISAINNADVYFEQIADVKIDLADLTYSQWTGYNYYTIYCVQNFSGNYNGKGFKLELPDLEGVASKYPSSGYATFISVLNDGVLSNLLVVGGRISEDAKNASFNSIIVEGDYTYANNMGLFANYVYGECNFEDCIARATVNASSYSAVFAGACNNAATLNFTNCYNEGSYTGPEAALFLGNFYGSGKLCINVVNSGNRNGGSVRATRMDSGYNYNCYISMGYKQENCTITLNGEVSSIETILSEGFAQGPNDTLAITRNEDNTFTISKSSFENASYYVVYVYFYATSKEGGTHIQTVEETIEAAEWSEYTTTIKYLAFTSNSYSATGNTIDGWSIVKDGDTEYYYFDNGQDYQPANNVKPSVKICAYDANKNLLSSSML